MSEIFERVQQLCQAPVFEKFPVDCLYQLAETAHEQRFNANQPVLGSSDSQIVVVTAGQVYLFVEDTKGQRRKVGSLAAPCTLNEAAPFDSNDSSVSADAATDGVCLRIEAAEIRDLLRRQPDLAAHFARALSESLGKTYRTVVEQTNIADQVKEHLDGILAPRLAQLLGDRLGAIDEKLKEIQSSRPQIDIRLISQTPGVHLEQAGNSEPSLTKKGTSK